MNETAITNHQRRRFLATAKIAGAVAVIALLAKKTSEPAPPAAAVSTDDLSAAPSTYHETEHIRKYYRSADLL